MALENGVLNPVLAAMELDLPYRDIESAVRDLLDLHLLHDRQPARDEDTAGHPAYTANSPDVAVTHLNGPLEARIRRLQRRADRISSHVMTMRPVFEDAWQSHFLRATVERLTGLDAIRTVLERLSSTARVEIAAAHPLLPSQTVIEEGRRRTAEAAGRGILLRTLYPHSVLSHPYMRQHLAEMSDTGVAFRTVDHIPDRIIFFDAGTAVIADPEQTDGQGALVVRDPSLVRYLYRSWESMWVGARPFSAADAEPPAAPRDEVRQAVLRMLEAGMKDEMAARKLSMSTTTYRRHVSELLTELGAHSRFQAGSYARRVGWLDD
ncbi:LuxR C-terminal-related transcriptional regulator [Streptomyces sp. NPDC013455]|uniref:LuxR C-terminal-related transcriptional regulator n=1 Tax=Streptomyces sp. NPDC013455 TaxID=3155605 RepID=UPI0033E1B042